MDAQVTLKAAPHELNTIRDALRFYASNEGSVADDKSVELKLRHAARQNEAKAKLLLDKIGG